MTQVAITIIFLLCFYGFLVTTGLPQQWTQMVVDAHSYHDAYHHDAAVPEAKEKNPPPLFMVTPFALLLLCIAFFPLIPATERWWHCNMNRFYVATGFAVITLLYYLFFHSHPIELHWPAHGVTEAFLEDGSRNGFGLVSTVFLNAFFGEYVPFIVLLFSLYTICGGIRISGDLKATPLVNTTILLIGTLIASFIGTTGAAMVLIRLLLETNQSRKYKVHTIVMFIICVCNCGGTLTPLGDPPLFLGYLYGVPFLWPMELWPYWLFINTIMLTFYFLWDSLWYYPKESAEGKAGGTTGKIRLSVVGWKRNLPLLLGVIACVAFLDPARPVPGTDWHPWYFLREAIQLAMCALSLLDCKKIRIKNTFNFLAIGEVAALFFGIFITMQVPLQILNKEGPNLGVDTPLKYFWTTGSLSCVLDNAPTYVVFFRTAQTLSPLEEELRNDPNWSQEGGRYPGEWVNKTFERPDGKVGARLIPITNGYIYHHFLIATALGTVFMGAMTYIANGPNFMVKAIAEQSGVKMPSFFGYMGYTCVILLLPLIIMTLTFAPWLSWG